MTNQGASQHDAGLNQVLIWDLEELPEITNDKVALWRSFSCGSVKSTVSIPALVEINADILRQRYLAWVYELGNTLIQGRKLVDCLEIRPGFSYWWMTLFVEKCNYSKSPQIYNAIKLMAFQDWLVGQSLTHIKLVSDDKLLARCVKAWCGKADIFFEWQQVPKKIVQVSLLRRIYNCLPFKLKALTWLAHYLVRRWTLKGVGLDQWTQSTGVVTFFSYFFNLTPNSVNVGKFEGSYWANLPDALKSDGCQTNWLHIYVKDSLIPNARIAAKVIREFNVTGKGHQVHVMLDTFLGWRVVFRALRDWRFVNRAVLHFQYMPTNNSKDTIDFWPLFSDEWKQSFIGVSALSNLLNLNLYEEAQKALPVQRVGIYLQENQGWEFAFVHAWKATGHGRLIGAPHSSVRFWDLRYFFDPRSYDRKKKNNLPMPDLVAVNGTAAMNAYVNGNYPSHKLLLVEALRYLYLIEYSDRASKAPRPIGAPLNVLAMGDYALENTQLQMRLLEQAASLLPKNTVFVIKPHPHCPVKPLDYPGVSVTVSMEPLSVLLAKCDVAYSSGVTSAAAEASCAGVPVISVLDPAKLNMSPLRGFAGASFVTTPKELADALILDTTPLTQSATPPNFFCLDSTLQRWRGACIGRVEKSAKK